jgi:hypothetical protein
MESIEELNKWFACNYPDIRARKLKEGAWCVEQMVDIVEHMPLNFTYEYDGFGYKVPAATLLFEVKNRFVGGWVCDEIIRRDPKLAHNEGNMFHEAYKASFAADEEHKQMNKDHQDSALSMWETARRNPALMERITDHLACGNTDAACKELSPEVMFKHALKESPSELRRKDYWRNL